MSYEFSGVILLSDIDGTLAWSGDISEENLNAVRFFTENGGKFTVATGRSSAYIREYYTPRLRINAPMATINGTVLETLDSGIIIWKKTLCKGFSHVIRTAYEYCECIEKLLVYKINETELCTRQFTEDDGEEYFKLLIVTEDEKNALDLQRFLTRKFGSRYVIMRSWSTGIEIIERGAGKGICLNRIKKMTGSKIAVAMGDYENDYEMFDAADISVAVANAVPQLKQKANYITVSGEQNAVAKVIEDLPKIIGEYRSK